MLQHCNAILTVYRLIALGFDVNYQNMEDSQFYLNTPLINAIDFDCNELVEVLLANGANPSIRCASMTALQVAASVGSISTAASLIQWGADVSSSAVTSDPSESSLGLALSNGNMNIARMLLQCCCTGTCRPADVDSFVESLGLEQYCIDEEVTEIKDLLMRNCSNARPLMLLCRSTITHTFMRNDKSLSHVAELSLPTKLKNFIRFKELDCYKYMDP